MIFSRSIAARGLTPQLAGGKPAPMDDPAREETNERARRRPYVDRFTWRWRAAAKQASAAPYDKPETTLCRIISFIAPWERFEYRGRLRTVQQAVGYPISATTVKDWRSGRRNPSLEYIDRLASYLRTQAALATDLADQLDAMKPASVARKSRAVAAGGARAVKDRDGTGVQRDGRGKGARPKTGI